MIDDGPAPVETEILIKHRGSKKDSASDKIIEKIPWVGEQEPFERAEERSVYCKADDVRQPVDMDLGLPGDKCAGKRNLEIAEEEDLRQQDRGGKTEQGVQESGFPSPEIAIECKDQNE